MNEAATETAAMKDLRLSVRITPEQRQLLGKAADKDALKLSAWIRRTLIQTARRTLDQA